MHLESFAMSALTTRCFTLLTVRNSKAILDPRPSTRFLVTSNVNMVLGDAKLGPPQRNPDSKKPRISGGLSRWGILGPNQLPLPCQGSALPLRQSPKLCAEVHSLEVDTGFEPVQTALQAAASPLAQSTVQGSPPLIGGPLARPPDQSG